MFTAPLEQFQILPIFSLKVLGFDLSFTNFFLINVLALLILMIITFLGKKNLNKKFQEETLYIPNSWQKTIELIAEVPAQLVSDTINVNNNIFDSL